jgi:cytochrome c oxidase cbb3-type subunit 4
MSHGILSGITTALSLIAFLGVVFWAYGANRRGKFERAARVPLEEGRLEESRLEEVTIEEERSP